MGALGRVVFDGQRVAHQAWFQPCVLGRHEAALVAGNHPVPREGVKRADMPAGDGDTQQVRLLPRPRPPDQRRVEAAHRFLGEGARLVSAPPRILVHRHHLGEVILCLGQRVGAGEGEVRAVEPHRAPDLAAGVGA